MGKSDPYVFSFYADILNESNFLNTENIAIGFFGYEKETSFTKCFKSKNKFFFDLKLNNWNINEFPYTVNNSLDVIICTRVAYFSNQPKKMISCFLEHLKSGGIILIDWGLGDHWRFKEYKIGWLKNKEHEWAYEKDNFLWSCYLSKDMITSDAFNLFKNNCIKFGYKNVVESIKEEVPEIITKEDIESIGGSVIKEKSLFLWPDAPQLYTCLIIKKV